MPPDGVEPSAHRLSCGIAFPLPALMRVKVPATRDYLRGSPKVSLDLVRDATVHSRCSAM